MCARTHAREGRIDKCLDRHNQLGYLVFIEQREVLMNKIFAKPQSDSPIERHYPPASEGMLEFLIWLRWFDAIDKTKSSLRVDLVLKSADELPELFTLLASKFPYFNVEYSLNWSQEAMVRVSFTFPAN